MKFFASGAFFRVEARILELNRQPEVGVNVSDVLFAGSVKSNDFPPGEWELVLPVAMPFRLWLLPSVANSFASMRPMMNPLLSTLWQHWAAASWA